MRRRYRKILFFSSYSSEKKIYHGTKSYDKHVNKPQAFDFKHITYEAKPDPELIIKSVLEHFTYLKFRNSVLGELITIILHHLSRGTRHALFAMENMEIMDYMAHGTAKMGISSLMILN
jgi:hypothetical protein